LLTRRLSLIAIAATILGVLFINIPVTQATDCSETLKSADADHKKTVQQHKPGTDAYLAALYKIEDELFAAMKRCQDNSSVVSAMGELQLSLGQVPIAQLYGQKAIEMNNTNWQAHYVLGSALNLQKKYSEGLLHLKQASKLNPENYSLLANLCSSYEKNKLFSEAIKTCTTVIKKGPYNIHGTAYYLRALAYTGNGEHTLAERDNKLAKEFNHK